MYTRFIEIKESQDQIFRSVITITSEDGQELSVKKNLLGGIKVCTSDGNTIIAANVLQGVKENGRKVSKYPSLEYSIGTGISGQIQSIFGRMKMKPSQERQTVFKIFIDENNEIAQVEPNIDKGIVRLEYIDEEFKGIFYIICIEILSLYEKGFDD